MQILLITNRKLCSLSLIMDPLACDLELIPPLTALVPLICFALEGSIKRGPVGS